MAILMNMVRTQICGLTCRNTRPFKVLPRAHRVVVDAYIYVYIYIIYVYEYVFLLATALRFTAVAGAGLESV
jgi:hypothetical protein